MEYILLVNFNAIITEEFRVITARTNIATAWLISFW